MTVGILVATEIGEARFYSNTSTADNEEAIVTGDLSHYDSFMLMSTAGAVDVLASLDGTNYSTAPLSLQDMGGTTTDPVLVTAAGRMYGFRGKFRKLKVLQSGATGVTVQLICGKL